MADFIDTTHNFISYANSNKNKISKIVINSILLFIIFAIFGCFDFVNFTVDITLLANWKYWTQVFAKTTGGAIAFNIGINLLFDKEIESDKVLAEQREKYQRLNDKKDQTTFNYYVVNVFNKEEKKKAYKDKINRKIYWLNKFSTNKSKLLYSTTINENVEDYEKKLEELNEQKAKNKYCVKRKELEELKSDEYIEKNIDSIIVKYNMVDPIVFELEIDGSRSYRGVKTKGDVNIGRARLTSGVVLGMILISMIITSIVLAPDQQQFENQMVRFGHYVASCASDTGIILWQAFRGMINARKLVSQELTEPFAGRNRVLDCYYQWVIDNDIAPTKGQQIAKLLTKGDYASV